MTETNNIRDKMCQAIEQRKVIAFTRQLKDENTEFGYCVGHPHILYKASTGNELVDIWTISGYSKRGNLPAWRRYKLDEICEVVLTDEQFYLEPTFKLDNDRHIEIFCLPKYN